MYLDTTIGGSAVGQQGGIDELFDELPLGVLQLGPGGSLLRANPAARQLLDGFAGPEIEKSVVQMSARAGGTGHMVEAVLSAGNLGELRILLSAASAGGGFIAFIERSATTRLRAEIQILRTLLTCLTVRQDPRDALEPGLASLAGTLASGYVILYELDPQSQMLSPLAHVSVPAEHQAMLLPHPVGPLGTSIGRAAALGTPVHVGQLARAPFPLERTLPRGDRLSGLALPVKSGVATLGAIFVCAPMNMLGEGELRLVQGLADTLGALLDRARQDEALRREQRARQSLMDGLPDAVVESGQGGLIALAGGRVKPILGRSASELVGTPVSALLDPADRAAFAGKVRDSAPDRTPIAAATVVQPDGRSVPVEISLQRVGEAPESGVRAVFRDVSERKALEADVQRSRAIAVQREKMALIGQLAASITHEINNPLAFVRSNLEVIGSTLTADEPGKPPDARHAQLIRECVLDSLHGLDRVSTIIHALKRMARRQPREVVEFDAATAVREAVLIFERAKAGSCNVELDMSELPPVLGSPGGLSQVLLNLLDNALDAMGGSGNIAVSARLIPRAVEIQVIDRGPGISEEARAHLFEPYFTTKESGKGSGLGLYLSKEILDSAGGGLDFTTGPQGTTFTVRMPVAHP